jgi:hypothetical protein
LHYKIVAGVCLALCFLFPSSLPFFMASKQFHVMMSPWMAFGHMIPFLELSKKLSAKGVRISFLFTQRNVTVREKEKEILAREFGRHLFSVKKEFVFMFFFTYFCFGE